MKLMSKTDLNKYLYYLVLGLIILLGFYLRSKGYFTNPSFWHDECGLAWNIKFKNYSELFGNLRFLQVAPPFFLLSTKFLTNIFGFSEVIFRLIPFLTACLSIIGFYFIARKVLNKKSSLIMAVFLFVINYRLINFSFEFKPYESDVFFTIICLLFFINLDIEKLNIKKALFYGLLLSIIPWFSFVSVFIMAGGFLNLVFKENLFKNKKVLLLVPLIISLLIYLKVYLFTNYTGTHMVTDWQNYFVTANPLSFLYLLAESIRYLFFPIQYVLPLLILFIYGVITYSKEKSKFFHVAILSFFAFIIASFFHIYPFGDRVITFLIPIYLLFLIKPLDLISFDKKIKSLVIVLIFSLGFSSQVVWTGSYIHSKGISKGEHAREMMKFLVENIKKDDIIIVNNFSNTEFAYYSSFYDIKNQVIQEPQKSDQIKFLDSIKKDSYCWFYVCFGNPQQILLWSYKNAKIIKIIHDNKASNYLIYAYIK